MSEIYKNKRFKDDLSLYSTAIDKIADEQEKLAAKKLLGELIYEVKKMDNMYLDLVYSRSLGTAGNEFRDKIGSIRKQLDNKIKSNSK
jgi:hypothetical protein